MSHFESQKRIFTYYSTVVSQFVCLSNLQHIRVSVEQLSPEAFPKENSV